MPDEVKTLAADAGFGASAIIAKNEPYAKASPTRGGGIERSDDDGEVLPSAPFPLTDALAPPLGELASVSETERAVSQIL